MSTVKAVNFQHPSSTAANLTLAADGTVTGGLPAGGRNLLYNGAMQVAQRGTSTAGITGGKIYTADRWYFSPGESPDNAGTWTNSIEADAPTGSGFRNSFKMLCTTAKASLGSTNAAGVYQNFEGQDLQRIAKGTASAQQLTLSFWVKSNVTGTYIIYLYDNDNNRICSQAYTISASATWEKKTITFPADTTGVLDNDNAFSMQVYFSLAAGSGLTSGTLQTTWATYSAANSRVGQTNLAAATNNYWQVTGVQLEVGPVASAFEFKPYGQELRECQRYYWRAGASDSGLGIGYGLGSNTADVIVRHPVTMRTGPTVLDYSGLLIGDGVNAAANFTSVTLIGDPDGSLLSGAGTSTQYRPYSLRTGAAGYLGLGAEL